MLNRLKRIMLYPALLCFLGIVSIQTIHGQTVHSDTLFYYNPTEIRDTWLPSMDWVQNYGVHFTVDSNQYEYSVQKIEFLFSSVTLQTHPDRWPLTVPVTIHSSNNDSAPGAVIDNFGVILADTVSDLYPHWKSIDVSHVSALQHRTGNFWVQSTILYWTVYDSLPPLSNHTRHYMATPYGYYWESTQDLAVRSIVTYHPVSVHKEPSSIPEIVTLPQNAPNPFNTTTSITFQLRSSGKVKLEVYDLKGRLIQMLLDHWKDHGTHVTRWNGHNVPSGVYILVLRVKTRTDSYIKSRKMLLLE